MRLREKGGGWRETEKVESEAERPKEKQMRGAGGKLERDRADRHRGGRGGGKPGEQGTGEAAGAQTRGQTLRTGLAQPPIWKDT